ncbi:MAG: hypothetical protein JOY59_12945 [Candidatus Eremiobacteraeota bacterium]|nr:hypothetical protein [Candidatus Eremiobacteraeota bacterium]
MYDKYNNGFWFSGSQPTGTGAQPAIGLMTPTGQERMFPVPVTPTALAAAPDGAVWFVENNSGAVARLDPNSGAVSSYVLPQYNGGSPGGIAVRSDGKVWIGSYSGTVFLLDPVAYDAQGWPHELPTSRLRR